MEIILSKQCESLTGSLGRGFGYFIQRRCSKKGKPRFFSQRSKHTVPPDGHWRMICACANLAEMKLHIADIKVSAEEVADALSEAGLTTPAYCLKAYPEDYPKEFNAVNINKLKSILTYEKGKQRTNLLRLKSTCSKRPGMEKSEDGTKIQNPLV